MWFRVSGVRFGACGSVFGVDPEDGVGHWSRGFVRPIDDLFRCSVLRGLGQDSQDLNLDFKKFST